MFKPKKAPITNHNHQSQSPITKSQSGQSAGWGIGATGAALGLHSRWADPLLEWSHNYYSYLPAACTNLPGSPNLASPCASLKIEIMHCNQICDTTHSSWQDIKLQLLQLPAFWELPVQTCLAACRSWICSLCKPLALEHSSEEMQFSEQDKYRWHNNWLWFMGTKPVQICN